MGYYIRVFCTSPDVPSLHHVLNWMKKEGYEPSIGPDSADNWEQVDLVYKEGGSPLVVDITRADGSDSSLFNAEIQEFMEWLEEIEDSPDKQKVLHHLQATSYMVGIQLLLSNFDDEGYAAVNTFTEYFVQHHGGMVQADNEGFYEGDRLLVEV